MTSHMTFCAVPYSENGVKYLHNEHLDRIDNFSDFYHSLVHMDHLVPVKCKKKYVYCKTNINSLHLLVYMLL